ncbi:MAG: RNA polymerase sigma factor [Thermoanaerobaculia bacterium]
MAEDKRALALVGRGSDQAPTAGPDLPTELSPEVEALYRQLFEMLVRYARCRHRLQSEDARDVVQDAFIVLIDKIESVRNAPAWLRGVVDGIAINRVRTRQRRADALVRWGPGTWLTRPFEEN